jgi:hypothetical protein
VWSWVCVISEQWKTQSNLDRKEHKSLFLLISTQQNTLKKQKKWQKINVVKQEK